MSHILCMLCGLQRPIKNYDPSNYDNELYLISKKSKGYRAGFEDDYESILGDDVYTPLIKNRIIEIVRAFRENGIISDQELGIIPKKEETKDFMDKVVERLLFKALTGDSDDSDIRILESQVRELTEERDKLHDDYMKRGKEHIELIRKLKAAQDYSKSILLKDVLNYALMHFLKYCDAEIGGSNLDDFKVFLMSLDNYSMTLLGCLYQDLSVEEWCSLMDKIQGTPPVQALLDYSTMLKRAETDRGYDKILLLSNLMMFRILRAHAS